MDYTYDRGPIFNESFEEFEKRVVDKWGSPNRVAQDVYSTPEGKWQLPQQLMNPINTIGKELVAAKRKRQKEQDLLDRIMNHSIAGETYIVGGTRAWKEIVLSEYPRIMEGKTDMAYLLKLFTERRFTFSQPDKLVEHPIREFMAHVSKAVVKCTHSELPFQKGRDQHYQIYARGKEDSFVIFHLPILDVPDYESKVEITFFTLDDLKVFFLDSEEGKKALEKLNLLVS